jgi:hypothetical protein
MLNSRDYLLSLTFGQTLFGTGFFQHDTNTTQCLSLLDLLTIFDDKNSTNE